ncbi:unnamed protein product [Prorocentrum cordatum]|uniref:Poly [ADP-ribose] polymerase n=1 Tax=Prorocentrum cordatum TaxID=2364126 RepID=A0ABN9VYV8_9DINO|nr:unnamed protein product [Polarella glacialis]
MPTTAGGAAAGLRALWLFPLLRPAAAASSGVCCLVGAEDGCGSCSMLAEALPSSHCSKSEAECVACGPRAEWCGASGGGSNSPPASSEEANTKATTEAATASPSSTSAAPSEELPSTAGMSKEDAAATAAAFLGSEAGAALREAAAKAAADQDEPEPAAAEEANAASAGTARQAPAAAADAGGVGKAAREAAAKAAAARRSAAGGAAAPSVAAEGAAAPSGAAEGRRGPERRRRGPERGRGGRRGAAGAAAEGAGLCCLAGADAADPCGSCFDTAWSDAGGLCGSATACAGCGPQAAWCPEGAQAAIVREFSGVAAPSAGRGRPSWAGAAPAGAAAALAFLVLVPLAVRRQRPALGAQAARAAPAGAEGSEAEAIARLSSGGDGTYPGLGCRSSNGAKTFPPPCSFGLSCYRKNLEHFVEMCHPDDDHYVLSIRQHEMKGQFLTLRQCFRYADPFKKGFIDDKMFLSQMLDQLKITFTADELKVIWDAMDEDCEGVVHFSEFVDWAMSGRGPAVLKALPVGMEEEQEDFESKDFSVKLVKKSADDKWGLDLLGQGTARRAAQIRAVRELGLADQWNAARACESRARRQRAIQKDDWVVSVNGRRGIVQDLLNEFKGKTCEFVVHPREVVEGLECKFVSKQLPHGCPCKGYCYNPEHGRANLCTCGHRHGLHVRTSDSAATGCPVYWTIHSRADSASMNRAGICPVGHTLKEVRRGSTKDNKGGIHTCGAIAELGGECLSGLPTGTDEAGDVSKVKLFCCRREALADEHGFLLLNPTPGGSKWGGKCDFVVCEKCRDFRVMLEGLMDGDGVTITQEIKSADGLICRKGWRGKITLRQYQDGQIAAIKVLFDELPLDARIPRSSFGKLAIEKATGPRWVDCEPEVVCAVQQAVDMSKKRVWTRDRGKAKVPDGFDVVKVKRNENLAIWKKYDRSGRGKASLLKRGADDDPDSDQLDFKAYKVATSQLNSSEFMKPEPLDESVNEWMLWHGTTIEGARGICEVDFKQKYAGTQTGSLYGKGIYFAESFTKADEYAGPCGGPDDAEADLLVVLLCRVVGGRVHYTDQDTPDPHFLSKSVVHGSYDSVLGDREKLKGTFREFIVYNNDQAYPEYIVMYRRRYIDPAPDPKKAPPTPVTTTSTISSATIAASHRGGDLAQRLEPQPGE